jgi:thioester reductase-like protein
VGQDGVLRVKDFYRGKNIFITGCTGFLAKVILEKIFRTMPDVGTIFVLVRPKRRVDPMDRVRKEILTSPCFKKLWEIYGGELEFQEFAVSKIVPVTGDLIKEQLGIPEQDREMLREKIHIIINSAASVNFDDPLQDALQINYFGCQRVLELAKECRNLEVYTHVSTCYVNCTRTG